MKAREEPVTVSRIAALLRRSRLLSGPEVDALQQRWRQEAVSVEDQAAFARWLVSCRYVTEFQMALLLGNQPDHLVLGPYKLLERINRGPRATIYKAVHRLGHFAALKVLPSSKDPRLLARFQQETELAQRLIHHHLVRTLERGQERGLHYLAMEYLEGETLQQRLDQRSRLSPEVAGEIIRQALLGLGYLYEQGLVHGNLEPANLMLQRTVDENGTRLTVKILDFRFVRAAKPDPASAASSSETEEAERPSPRYCAPERGRDPATADIRADIFTLGSVLHHALTGQPLTDPSSEAPLPRRQVKADLPEALEQIVGLMVANDPAERYATPAQAAIALESFLNAARAIPEEDTALTTVSVELVAPGLTMPIPVIATLATPLPTAVEEVPFAGPLAIEEASSAETAAWPGTSEGQRRQRRRGLDLGLTRRDYWVLLLGGIGLLVAELLGWLVAWLLGFRS